MPPEVADEEGPAALPMPEGDDHLLSMPHGLPGFPDCRRFSCEMVGGTSGRFVRLRSADDGGPCFLLAVDARDGSLIDANDLTHACSDTDLRPDALIVLFVVTMDRAGGAPRLFVNRRAPVIVDAARRIGMQVVLPRPDYHVRHPLLAA